MDPPYIELGVRSAFSFLDGASTPEDLRAVIEQDPAIVARVLKVSNSSIYSFSREITTLTHAITLLGFRTVRNLVLAASLRQAFKEFGELEKKLWEHSVVAGAIASMLAERDGMDVEREEAFTAGLLHDLGKVALANNSRDEYLRVDAEVEAGRPAEEAEVGVFGFDHAELGACVARKWKLPEHLEAVIRHHHQPDQLPALTEPVRRLTALTTVTSALCTRVGIGRSGPVEDQPLASLAAWQTLGLSEDDEETILASVEEQAKELAAVFG